MDLDFTEEHEMLREMVRGVCAEYSPLDVVRALEDEPVGAPRGAGPHLDAPLAVDVVGVGRRDGLVGGRHPGREEDVAAVVVRAVVGIGLVVVLVVAAGADFLSSFLVSASFLCRFVSVLLSSSRSELCQSGVAASSLSASSAVCSLSLSLLSLTQTFRFRMEGKEISLSLYDQLFGTVLSLY